jgi:predicted DCC family thiol-disulfide oxidoreductase YuxK
LISVYYDGKCGLCAREIDYFKRHTPRTPVQWHDIARDPGLLEGTGLSQAEALLYMRVRDASGTLHAGVDAFIVLWGQFRGWRLLAGVLSLPGLHFLASAAYRVFARIRFQKHPHCRASLSS